MAWPPMARTQGAVESCGCGERMLRTMVDCWCVSRITGDIMLIPMWFLSHLQSCTKWWVAAEFAATVSVVSTTYAVSSMNLQLS